MNEIDIDMLVDLADADGVWAMLEDYGMYDEAAYIEENYFDKGEDEKE